MHWKLLGRPLFALRLLIVLGACVSMSIAVGPTPAQADVDVYVTPGQHMVNGRQWRTSCEPYSQTRRCRTEILATQVKLINGRYTSVHGWAFNNLTYDTSSPSLWKNNPLGIHNNNGWTATDGRKWRTECGSPTTGENGCRSYVVATVIEALPAGGYRTVTKEVFNNMVRLTSRALSVGDQNPPWPAPARVPGSLVDLTAPVNTSSGKQAMVHLINERRTQLGYRPVRYDASLDNRIYRGSDLNVQFDRAPDANWVNQTWGCTGSWWSWTGNYFPPTTAWWTATNVREHPFVSNASITHIGFSYLKTNGGIMVGTMPPEGELMNIPCLAVAQAR